MLTERSGQYTLNSSVYSVIGRWQRPIITDRTRLVALNPRWNLTVLDRMLNPQGPISTDRTRPVTDFLFWNLTGVDRTLDLSVRSLQPLSVWSCQMQSPWSNELTEHCGQRSVSI